MRIIFSRDRAAQLDLLLTSLERNAEPEPTAIIYRATTAEYSNAYEKVWREHRPYGYVLLPEWTGNFERLVRKELDVAGEFTTFLCDDDVLYRDATDPFWKVAMGQPPGNSDILCFSLRLGANTTTCYPTNIESDREFQTVWNWCGLPPDWGYPGSLDGHVFRTDDLQRILRGKRFGNPTHLELALVAGCNALAEERPLMACYPHSVLVGVPLNRVSAQSGVRHGGKLMYSPEVLNRAFLDGMRLSLDDTDWSGVNGAHAEIDLRWQAPVESVV